MNVQIRFNESFLNVNNPWPLPFSGVACHMDMDMDMHIYMYMWRGQANRQPMDNQRQRAEATI